MSAAGSSPVLLEQTILSDHDYVWARLPFVVPMAIAAARHRGNRASHQIVQLVRILQPLLLDHLDREETMLVGRAAENVAGPSRDLMHEEHVAVTALIDQIRVATRTCNCACGDADPTERALHLELARLDTHVRAQIAVEERLMALRQRAAGAAS
jgi:iron-sulfur cluster repair protein YtfE (RIC family)